MARVPAIFEKMKFLWLKGGPKKMGYIELNYRFLTSLCETSWCACNFFGETVQFHVWTIFAALERCTKTIVDPIILIPTWSPNGNLLVFLTCGISKICFGNENFVGDVHHHFQGLDWSPSDFAEANFVPLVVFGKSVSCDKNVWKPLHPGRLTWNIIMEVGKMIFLSKWVIYRFHVNLPGWSHFECQLKSFPGSVMWNLIALPTPLWSKATV